MNTFMSPERKARREAELVLMRAKWKRDRVTVRRDGKKPELLRLRDLARAIRFVKRWAENQALIDHLEIAASYFDDAETGIPQELQG